MIDYEKHILNNGLQVFVNSDYSTPLAAFSMLYGVGSRDESPDRTGLAHFFEHLLFEGSKHIEKFDVAVQTAGGENNAFTNSDVTNTYITIPATNLETAFWVESDRLANPLLSNDKIEIQRKVVIEEFKQRYLNKPYGDVNLHLLPLAYTTHPYRWPTIGADVSHIEAISAKEIHAFFKEFYQPSNAVLAVSGPVDANTVFKLSEKWFSDIPSSEKMIKRYVQEPRQTTSRQTTLEQTVPADALFIAYHTGSRLDKSYYSTDLLSDILSSGKSSRLYRHLTLEKQLFADIQAVISGTHDPGLFLVSGRISQGVDILEAEQAVYEELNCMVKGDFGKDELEKVKNKAVVDMTLSKMNTLNKALNLCNAAILEDMSVLENEEEYYLNVTKEDVTKTAKEVFAPDNRSVVYYKAKAAKKNKVNQP